MPTPDDTSSEKSNPIRPQAPVFQEFCNDDSFSSPTHLGAQYLGRNQSQKTLPPLPTLATLNDTGKSAESSPRTWLDYSGDLSEGIRQSSITCNKLWIKELADVNVKLFEHAATLPTKFYDFRTKETFSSAFLSQIEHGDNGTQLAYKKKEGFAIDRTFELSRELLAILTEICTSGSRSRICRSVQSRVSPKRDTNDSIDTPSISSGSATKNDRLPVLLCDTGSILLILSSYTRILDIYDRFIGLVTASLSRPKDVDISEHVPLPNFIIGSFSLGPTLQTTLMIRLVEEVFERLRLAFSRVAFQAKSGRGQEEERNRELEGTVEDDGSCVGVPETILQATRDRELRITRRMTELRRRLQRFGDDQL